MINYLSYFVKTHLSISILRDKSEMKDDLGIQGITTKTFFVEMHFTPSLSFSLTEKRLHKQENKPLCYVLETA